MKNLISRILARFEKIRLFRKEVVLVQESRSIQTIEKSDFFKKSDFLDF